METETDKKFLQSYLYTEKFGNFFISTCYRRSSAMLNPDGWYYETFAWKLKEEKERELKIIADNSGAISKKGAINQHMEVVKQLEEKGHFEEVVIN